MKLEAKLGISTGTLILAMLVSASVAHLQLLGVSRMAHEIDNQRRPFVFTALCLNRDLTDAVVALQTEILFGSGTAIHSESARSLIGAHKAIDSDLEVLRRLGDQLRLGPSADQLDKVAQQVREIESRERFADEQSSPASSEASTRAHAILQQEVLPRNKITEDTVGSVIATQNVLIASQLAALHQANIAVDATLWAATLLGAIVGGLISFAFARRITRGIRLLDGRAHAIASGDLTGPALNIDSSDQIGSLARAMQEMQGSLAAIIGTVAQTAASLTASAISMNSATGHIHRRVQEQTQQTQQAATAMQEMSASIAEVSRHTKSAAETARSAAETAHEGDAIVKQMLCAMQSIATAVNQTSSTIGLLGEESHRISQIVTVIDEIARKTNLLALNAAIEAARAGDHGRGFAVVAGEVRRLAESTAQATGEISAMIQGIQDRTSTSVASMASGAATVEQGVTTTQQAGQALERIIGIAERVDRMIAQIAIATSQQAAAADQSSSSLDSIHTLSYDNLSEMATTTAGIEGLRATAAALKSQVERFRLDQPQSIVEPRRNSLRPASATPETAPVQARNPAELCR